MTHSLKSPVIVTLGLLLLFSVGCSGKPARVYGPDIDAGAAGTAAMDQYDANKDGKIDETELAKAPGLNAALERVDKDHDKAVTADEITERIIAWKNSKFGLTDYTATVKYRGHPVAGATVVFEPEAFLGDVVKPAKGVTDQYGVAVMKGDDGAKPGVTYGMYKVKITKDGANIPAKYNTDTTLGVEIAKDVNSMVQGGAEFDLQ